ncbi:TraR/DksA family transcriptional regulator [Pandoraea sp.]|uniref:TraR/DksA family transcriptional regulator n=1 Tax=Pandoraea sp. TaxID=1883445 RepID=UPI0035AF6475
MDPLTKPGLAALATLIDKEELRIRTLLDAADSPVGETSAPEPGDEVDLANEETAERLDDALADHYRGQLSDIEAARERMRTGEYGVCIDCHEAIPHARLKAYPTAKRCTACQRRHEQLYAIDHGK